MAYLQSGSPRDAGRRLKDTRPLRYYCVVRVWRCHAGRQGHSAPEPLGLRDVVLDPAVQLLGRHSVTGLVRRILLVVEQKRVCRDEQLAGDCDDGLLGRLADTEPCEALLELAVPDPHRAPCALD